MGAGPLVAAAGLLLFQRAGVEVDYLSEVLPPLLVFALGPVDDGRAADSRGAGGSETAGGDRLGCQQRDRAGGGTAGHSRCGRGDRCIVRLEARSRACRARHWERPGEAAVSEAKRLPLGRPSVRGMPSAQAHAVSHAAEAASLHSFHLGMAIAAALVAIGGIVGVAGIRNPRADVKASDCAGGQLVGVSSPEGVSA